MSRLAAGAVDAQVGVFENLVARADAGSVAFDAYKAKRETGGFILIDRLSNNTVGTGMLHFALRCAHNIHLQHLDVDKAARAMQKGQGSAVIWPKGLSGSGKSTIANQVENRLHATGLHSYLLDGDKVRHGLLGADAVARRDAATRLGRLTH